MWTARNKTICDGHDDVADNDAPVVNLPESAVKRRGHCASSGGNDKKISSIVDSTARNRRAKIKGVEELTGSEKAFVRYIADGMERDDAYRKAFDNPAAGHSAAYRRAGELLRRPEIIAKLSDYQSALANACLWERVDMIDMLRQIAIEAINESHAVRETVIDDDTGRETVNITKRYDASAAAVALKAIDQAAKMCGFNEPEQVQHQVIIATSSELTELAE